MSRQRFEQNGRKGLDGAHFTGFLQVGQGRMRGVSDMAVRPDWLGTLNSALSCASITPLPAQGHRTGAGFYHRDARCLL